GPPPAGPMLSPPAGSPARSARRPRASAVSGVCSAGLSTIVLPAASAGAALRVIIAAGRVHGVMAAVTPTGRFGPGDRGGGLAVDHRGRQVPRGDARGHPDRLLEHEDPRVLAVRGDDVAVGAAALLGEPVEEAGAVDHLALGLVDRLALLSGEDPGDVVGA